MKIMFQGDSITDACRNRDSNTFLAGYSQRIKDVLGDKYEYCNYACSGDTSIMMLNRHECEFKKEIPDFLIFLIGINDMWRKYDGMSDQALTIDKTIENVKKTIDLSKKYNPNCKIIMLEPYLLPGPSNLFNDSKDDFPIMLDLYRKNFPSTVDKYIILNDVLNDEYKRGNILSDDGVHPNEAGHKFIGDYIVSSCKNLL